MLLDLIQQQCDAAGIILTDRQAQLLAHHLDAMLDANTRVNLTAITAPAEAVSLHVIDSLMAVPDVDRAPPGLLADIGSGAGYPGIPIAIATNREVHLVESIAKKCRFLQDVVTFLRIEGHVRPFNMRAEALARQHPAEYAVVTARALSSLDSLVELASPLLAIDGRLVAMKGRVEDAEIAAGDAAALMVGLRRIETREYRLSGREDRRSCVVYEKAGEARIALPRREGLAQRRPLG